MLHSVSMPKVFSAVFNSPAVRKAFWALVMAIAGAAGYSFVQGCTPSQLEDAHSAVDAAQAYANARLDCVQSALRSYDVLAHPEQTTPEDAAGLSRELRACLKPADGSDAGAR